MSILQCNTQYDTVDQLHKKLRQYTAAIESLRLKGSSKYKNTQINFHMYFEFF